MQLHCSALPLPHPEQLPAPQAGNTLNFCDQPSVGDTSLATLAELADNECMYIVVALQTLIECYDDRHAQVG